jgi:hypothetical protein
LQPEDSAPQPSSSEREKLLTYFLSIYHAPQRLRTNHRKIARSILSLKQGYDGLTKGRCFFCGKERDLELLQLHHKDGVESHNDVENLDLFDPVCNVKEDWVVRTRKKAELRQTEKTREKENIAPPGLAEQPRTEPQVPKALAISPWAVPTSLETDKHERMRPKWNKWIADMKKGPFAEFKDQKDAKLRARDLASMAVHALGEGSSETYRRYIEEDRFGPLEYWKEDGVWWVKFRGGTSTLEA